MHVVLMPLNPPSHFGAEVEACVCVGPALETAQRIPGRIISWVG